MLSTNYAMDLFVRSTCRSSAAKTGKKRLETTVYTSKYGIFGLMRGLLGFSLCCVSFE